MKALLATCIAGAIILTGTIIFTGLMIHRLGGNTPGATLPVAMADVAARFEPSVAGRFPMPGFPDERVSSEAPSRQDAAPDAGAGKVAAPALAAAVPEPSAEPKTAAQPGVVPAVVSAPSVMAKADSGDGPVETKPLDMGHRDAAQLVPTICDASSTGPQDFRYLICYVWSELPPAEKPAAIVLRSFKDIPVGTPVEEIKRASDAFGLDFTFMKAVAKIESGFDPKQRTGSYIGLFQLSKYEFAKFGSGDILNPRDNAVAAAYKIITEGILFQWVTGRKPDLNDLYLIHQQGWEGAAEHLSQPNRIAWKSMCATSEGREKGEKWCRRAIWGNTLPAVKDAWKSVEKLTSEAFVGMWRERVAHFQAKYMATPTATATAEQAK